MPRLFDIFRTGERGLLLLLWAAVAIMMLAIYWQNIGGLIFTDPDDALRMVQVRDLLNGQAWFDTTQYRINPAGGGGDIHWSRFIDAQIASVIALLQPLAGTDMAERLGAAAYPLLLLLILFWLIGRILARLGDADFVRCGLFITATSVTFLHYFVPLRLDHHNWQMLLSLAMLWLALGPPSVVRGLLAALVIALHLEISLEGLPYLVMFGALYALEWLRDPREMPRLFGFAIGLALIAPLWVLLMRGVGGVAEVHCDAFSRPYLLGASATGLLVAMMVRLPVLHRKALYRFIALALAGALGAAVFALVAPLCLDGPFAGLDPLVHKHWYLNIREGHPIWTQPASTIALFLPPSIAGLAAIFWNIAREENALRRAQWQRLAFVGSASFLLSLFVLRTTMVTHAFMVPAFVLPYLVYRRWAQQRASAFARTLALVASVLFLPSALGAAFVVPTDALLPPPRPQVEQEACLTPTTLAALGRHPPSTLFASLNIAPTLLAKTHHSVTATGHHRNNAAIHTHLTSFLAPPAQAEAPIRRTGATLLVICRNMADIGQLRDIAPNGLAAALYKGTPPPWLVPAPELGSKQLLVYRLAPAAAAKPE